MVLRASLWEAKLKHALTGADIDASQFGMAKDSVVKELRDHAVVNYIAWFDEAYAGPKGSSETDSPTPTSENPEPSATSASTPSAAGSPQAETS